MTPYNFPCMFIYIQPGATEMLEATAAPDAAAVTDEPAPYATEKDGQTTFAPEPDDEGANLGAVSIMIPTAYHVTRLALAVRMVAHKFKDVAKNERGVLSVKEAAHHDRMAKDFLEIILPQLETQHSLDFDTSESTLSALREVIGAKAWADLHKEAVRVAAVRDGETFEDARARAVAQLDDFSILLGNLQEFCALAVLPCLLETAERSYMAGVADRQATPDNLVLVSVQAVRALNQS